MNPSPALAAALEADSRVVVTFSSPWCPPCRALKQALDSELPNHPGIAAVHVDIAADPRSAQAFRVQSTPTLVAFVDGAPVARAVGFSGVQGLRRFLGGLPG